MTLISENIKKLADPLLLIPADILVILKQLVLFCSEGKEARDFLISNCCFQNVLTTIAVTKSIDVKREASHLLILLSESTEPVDLSKTDESRIPNEICSVISKSNLILDFKLFVEFIVGIKTMVKFASPDCRFGEIGKSSILLSSPCCNQILNRAIGFLSPSSSDIMCLPYSSSEMLMMQRATVLSLMWLLNTGIMNEAFKNDDFLVIFNNFTKCLEAMKADPKSDKFSVTLLLGVINDGGIPPGQPVVYHSQLQCQPSTELPRRLKRKRRPKQGHRGRSPGYVDKEYEKIECASGEKVSDDIAK